MAEHLGNIVPRCLRIKRNNTEQGYRTCSVVPSPRGYFLVFGESSGTFQKSGAFEVKNWMAPTPDTAPVLTGNNAAPQQDAALHNSLLNYEISRNALQLLASVLV